jgi:hypothetical protein
MWESLSQQLNKFKNNSIIKSSYFVLTKSVYTLGKKNPNANESDIHLI